MCDFLSFIESLVSEKNLSSFSFRHFEFIRDILNYLFYHKFESLKKLMSIEINIKIYRFLKKKFGENKSIDQKTITNLLLILKSLLYLDEDDLYFITDIKDESKQIELIEKAKKVKV